MPRMVGSPVPLQACCNHSGLCGYTCKDGWELSWGLAKRSNKNMGVCVHFQRDLKSIKNHDDLLLDSIPFDSIPLPY